jgi:hypothetical protein
MGEAQWLERNYWENHKNATAAAIVQAFDG